MMLFFFFFNDTATTEIYTLSLHDALPIYMRTLEYMDSEKAKYKARETLDIYAGIAHRLGIQTIKWELEDLSLRFLDPEGYYSLVKMVNKKREQREFYIANIVDMLKDKFMRMEINADVYGRPKHFYSIYRKMNTKHKSFEEIYDLTAVRVIVDSVKDCYGVDRKSVV